MAASRIRVPNPNTAASGGDNFTSGIRIMVSSSSGSIVAPFVSFCLDPSGVTVTVAVGWSLGAAVTVLVLTDGTLTVLVSPGTASAVSVTLTGVAGCVTVTVAPEAPG